MALSPLTRGRTLDHVAAVYDALSPLMLFGQEQRMARPCLQYIRESSVHAVLDVGCGTGTLTLEIAAILAQRGGTVVGVDAAPKMIAVARRKAGARSNVRFDVVAAEALPYGDESFDHGLSTFFFHHIDFQLKVKALDEAFRVLKPGGSFVIVDVDTPTSLFGRICAWSGYYLFKQEEIRENIEGKLRLAIEKSLFGSFKRVAHYQGYVSVFQLSRADY